MKQLTKNQENNKSNKIKSNIQYIRMHVDDNIISIQKNIPKQLVGYYKVPNQNEKNTKNDLLHSIHTRDIKEGNYRKPTPWSTTPG